MTTTEKILVSHARMAFERDETKRAFYLNRCPCCGQGVRLHPELVELIQCVGRQREPGSKLCTWQGFAR